MRRAFRRAALAALLYPDRLSRLFNQRHPDIDFVPRHERFAVSIFADDHPLSQDAHVLVDIAIMVVQRFSQRVEGRLENCVLFVSLLSSLWVNLGFHF